MLRKHLTKCLSIVLFIGIGGGFVYAIQNNSPDKVDLLLHAVDSSINAIEIKAEIIETFSSFYANQREQQRESVINSRRQCPGFDVDISPYEAKVFNIDIVTKCSTDILFLDDKIRVANDYPGKMNDYIFFYEPGKMYDISWDRMNLSRKMVVVDNIYKPPFLAITAHIFGRGLSRYAEYPKQMVNIDENQYQLTIFYPSQKDKKMAEFLLDSRHNYCWTSGQIFGMQGGVIDVLKASDFQKKEEIVFPHSIEMTHYTDKKLNYKYQISIQEIKSLPEDYPDLNVFDDIPPNSLITESM